MWNPDLGRRGSEATWSPPNSGWKMGLRASQKTYWGWQRPGSPGNVLILLGMTENA